MGAAKGLFIIGDQEYDPAAMLAVKPLGRDKPLPLIMRLGWYSAPDNDEATVAFRWLEEYQSRASMASDEFTEVCEALWEPIKSRAIDDSFAGAAFDQGGLIQR